MRKFDFVLFLTSLALVAYGVILIYSGSLTNYKDAGLALSHPVARQILFALAGVAIMLAITCTDYHLLGYAAIGLYIAALGALVLVLVVSSEVYGSRRWIEIAGTPVQPSEIAKLVLIIVLAKYLTDRQEQIGQLKTFLASLGIALVPTALVFAEPDLGSAVIFVAIWLAMVIIAGARSTHVLGLASPPSPSRCPSR